MGGNPWHMPQIPWFPCPREAAEQPQNTEVALQREQACPQDHIIFADVQNMRMIADQCGAQFQRQIAPCIINQRDEIIAFGAAECVLKINHARTLQPCAVR